MDAFQDDAFQETGFQLSGAFNVVAEYVVTIRRRRRM